MVASEEGFCSMDLVKITFMDTRLYGVLIKQGGVVSSYQPDRQICPKYR